MQGRITSKRVAQKEISAEEPLIIFRAEGTTQNLKKNQWGTLRVTVPSSRRSWETS